MSRYSVSSSALAQLTEGLSSILSESNPKSLSEQNDQLIDIRKRYDGLRAVVDKLVSKAQAGETDPAKRMYGPEMTAKVKKLGSDTAQFGQTLEETESRFKPKWDEFQQAKQKAENQLKAQAEKEEKERLEREEKERLEREKLEREEKERNEREQAERKRKAHEEKLRQEREEREKEERLRAELKLAEERKKKEEEEEKKRQEEREREAQQQSKARESDSGEIEQISLSIKTAKGATLSLDTFPKEGTVKDLKESIEKHHSIAEASQRLIFQGRLLADAKKIIDYKITNRSVVHLVENARAAAAAKAKSSATSSDTEPKWLVPPGTVHELTGGKTEFEAIAENCGRRRLLVVDWSASWCGPCKMIAPVFARLAGRFSNVTFVKVDTEKTPGNQQLAMEKQIQGYPTFHYYVGNAIVHQFSGASGAKMENGIRKGLAVVNSHAQSSSSSAGASGVDTRPLTDRVLSALTHLKNNCPSADFVVAVKTLLTFVKNVVDHPMEEKYRRVRTSNSTFQARLASKTGGLECMHAFGFESVQENGENFLVLSAAAASNPDLPRVKQQLEQALAAISGTGTASSAQQAGRAPAPDGIGGMGGMGGMGGNGGMPGMPGMPGFPGLGGAMPGMGGGMGGLPNIDPAMFGELMNDPSFMQLATEMGTDSSLQAAMLEAQRAMQSGDMAAMQRVMMNPAMARIGQAMANSPAMMNVMRRQFANGMTPGMFGNQNNQTTGMGNMAPNANGQTQQGGNGTATGGMPGAPPNIPGAPTTPEEEDRLLQEAIRLSMQDQTRSSGNDAPKKEGDQDDKQS